MNPILIGQAEEIDLVQPQVREMLAAPGFYIGGDSNNPEMNVPLISNKGLVFSMKIDSELDPERFLPTLTLKGPYRVDPDADTLEHHPDLVKASEQRDKLLAALNLIETDKDGDGFICREAMEQVREAIAQAEGAGA